jgi:2,3-bisphosphoglycerate-dependent phosphoglycerate mutase
MVSKIYMVRHAESPYKNGYEKSRGLSTSGLEASEIVASVLSDIRIDAIYSSDYTRAIQTVKPLAIMKQLEINEFSELRERQLKPENVELPYNDFINAIKDSFMDKNYSLNGGESIREVQDRAIPVIEMLLEKHKGKNIVIGTHGNIMTMIMKYYDDSFGFEFWESTSMPDMYIMTFNKNSLLKIERNWRT